MNEWSCKFLSLKGPGLCLLQWLSESRPSRDQDQIRTGSYFCESFSGRVRPWVLKAEKTESDRESCCGSDLLWESDPPAAISGPHMLLSPVITSTKGKTGQANEREPSFTSDRLHNTTHQLHNYITNTESNCRETWISTGFVLEPADRDKWSKTVRQWWLWWFTSVDHKSEILGERMNEEKTLCLG